MSEKRYIIGLDLNLRQLLPIDTTNAHCECCHCGAPLLSALQQDSLVELNVLCLDCSRKIEPLAAENHALIKKLEQLRTRAAKVAEVRN